MASGAAWGKRLDRRIVELLEAAPAFRADIAQSVEQRFRKPPRIGPFRIPTAPDAPDQIATDRYAWLRAPGAAVQLPDVPAEMLVDADFELGAWRLDRQFARTKDLIAGA